MPHNVESNRKIGQADTFLATTGTVRPSFVNHLMKQAESWTLFYLLVNNVFHLNAFFVSFNSDIQNYKVIHCSISQQPGAQSLKYQNQCFILQLKTKSFDQNQNSKLPFVSDVSILGNGDSIETFLCSTYCNSKQALSITDRTKNHRPRQSTQRCRFLFSVSSTPHCRQNSQCSL